MRGKVLLAGAALAVCVSAAWGQQTPPLPLVKPGDQPAKAEPAKKAEKIYDESADAQQLIDGALAKAKKNNRRVLIQWGANWCGWCRMLHETFATDKEIKKELLYEYDVVLIDVGHFDKNMELASKLGADLKKHGLPYLTVLGADGKVVANQDTGELELKGEVKGHDKDKVLKFLTDRQAEYQRAESVLADGLAQASKEHKRVFLHFGAPWCGWCHRLEDWMDKPEVARILAKDFVDVKIDQDRMVGAESVMKRYCQTPGGIPWFCVLGEDGTSICTSDGAKGNIGFPGEPAEIEHFIGMMNKSRKKMSEGDVGVLRDSLEKDNKQDAGHG
jgi:thiol:disulfide interchange protein